MLLPRELPEWTNRFSVRPYFGFLTKQQALSFCVVSSMAISLWTLFISAFELHLYAIVKHEVTYYGTWGMSYEFVYSGTPAVRSSLIFFCLLSAAVSLGLLITASLLYETESSIKIKNQSNLRKETFLIAALAFLIFRTIAYIFTIIVNDPMYKYWIIMGILNTLLILIQGENWLVFWTFYLDERKEIYDVWGKIIKTKNRSKQPKFPPDSSRRSLPESSKRLPQTELVATREILIFRENPISNRENPDPTATSPLLIHEIIQHPNIHIYSV